MLKTPSAKKMALSIITLSVITACSQSQLEEAVNSVTEVISNGLAEGNVVTTVDKEFSAIVESAQIPTATKTINCADIKQGETIKITGHSKLSEQCDLSKKSVMFVLDSSNTSLDCRGASLSQLSATNDTAITIKPKINKAISNITIANCHVQGYGHAMNIRQKTNPNTRYLKGMTTLAENQALAPHDIRIINVSSNGSTASGIFVGDHVYNAHFSDLLIRGSGTVGLYLEFGSQNNIIEDSVFVDNGFRAFKPNREAIAVDSSANNIIRNNQFIHNGLGGVLLYRNCFEHANDSTRSNHFKRTQSSQNNVIKGNYFDNEPTGVWVASRQSRDLSGFECGAYLMKESGNAKYYLDSAKNNQIIGNTFVAVDNSVVVEDDGTLITGNDFSQAGGVPISVGAVIREQTQYGAVADTVIKGNTYGLGQSATSQIHIRSASKALTTVDE